MWEAIASLLLSAFKWLFGGKQESEGEELGKTKAERDGLAVAIQQDDKANAARNAVRDDAGSLRDDPNNLDGGNARS